MNRSIMWLAIPFFSFACVNDKSDGNDNNDQDSASDTAQNQSDDTGSESDTGGSDTGNDGTENGGDLWATAWSILGTRCGSADSCHNRASGGSSGLNLPADDEATAKTNAEKAKSKISSEVSSGGMPQGDTLTEAERLMVTDWVDSL